MPRSPSVQLESNERHVVFAQNDFDQAVADHGVRLRHYRALPCPVGLVDKDDVRRPHPHHENCSNGFIYRYVGVLTSLFMGNSTHVRVQDPGLFTGSTVQVTFREEYDSCRGDRKEPPLVAPFDRFFLDEDRIAVVTWERFVHESAEDRLEFPAVCVTDLVDSEGRWYEDGKDFVVSPRGGISWVGPGPARDEHNRPAVCSIRYTYRPHWYVSEMHHEVRVTVDGDGRIVRRPQGAYLVRENKFLNEEREDADGGWKKLPQSPRLAREPGFER